MLGWWVGEVECIRYVCCMIRGCFVESDDGGVCLQGLGING